MSPLPPVKRLALGVKRLPTNQTNILGYPWNLLGTFSGVKESLPQRIIIQPTVQETPPRWLLLVRWFKAFPFIK
jgi:hypothetical protein